MLINFLLRQATCLKSETLVESHLLLDLIGNNGGSERISIADKSLLKVALSRIQPTAGQGADIACWLMNLHSVHRLRVYVGVWWDYEVI